MEAIELFYENKLGIGNFFPRKKSIESKKTMLLGSPFSGKTSLIMNHLLVGGYKHPLYIDMADQRADALDATAFKRFINEKKPSITIIENAQKLDNFDFLSEENEYIISATLPLNLEGFSTLELLPPDFEEFLMLYKKSSDVKNSFSAFFKGGSIPHLINCVDFDFIQKEQDLLALLGYRGVNLSLLKHIAAQVSRSTSIHRIYTLIKKNGKVSKDSLYKDIEHLLTQKIVFAIDEHGVSRPQKRFYLFDHALRDGLLASRDFTATFANMLFTEMRKKKGERIEFTANIDFLFPDSSTCVIAAPFLNEEAAEKKMIGILKDFVNTNEVDFVTLGNSFAFDYKGVHCEGIPFWEWALRE